MTQLCSVQENHLLTVAEQKQSLILAGTTAYLNHVIGGKINLELFKVLSSFLLPAAKFLGLFSSPQHARLVVILTQPQLPTAKETAQRRPRLRAHPPQPSPWQETPYCGLKSLRPLPPLTLASHNCCHSSCSLVSISGPSPALEPLLSRFPGPPSHFRGTLAVFTPPTCTSGPPLSRFLEALQAPKPTSGPPATTGSPRTRTPYPGSVKGPPHRGGPERGPSEPSSPPPPAPARPRSPSSVSPVNPRPGPSAAPPPPGAGRAGAESRR
ncbi:proline-rich protein HaeIII subfamily 1-like [Lynx canadensis]|uniref:proline-rich protein HaeIII subfamily 1-like n=1 Tax=Lynx canadensis TaxID=61383 RepID=UPI0011AFDADB|nr:proline-rich protein HaeIII subfamily 1-like [Lynx canadensis]